MSDGLRLHEVSYRRGSIAVLEQQTTHVPKGGTLVLCGANGVGKSTFLYLCAGLLKPDAGRIELNGIPAHNVTPSTLVRAGIHRGVVFQHGGLVAELSALENVKLPLRYHADLLKLSDGDVEQRARASLAQLDIRSPDFHALPSLLSFGMRRRVAFARALSVRPQFVFFDDPDAGLDRENAAVITQLIERYRDDPEVTAVIASNHRDFITRLGSPVLELEAGRLGRLDPAARPRSSMV